MISLNKKAPNIKLHTDNDNFNLKDLKGKNIIVFFFPKADTSGCTSEAISFSQLQDEFENLNCLVIGISKDSPEKQKKFREKYKLTCLLGADNETDVCERYGVWVEKSMYGRKYFGIQRSTFLISTDGIINFIWPKVKVPGHAEDVLNKLKEMSQ